MQHQALPGISPPYNDIHIPRNICCLGDACRNVIEINPCRDAPLECCAKEDSSRSPFTAKLQVFEAYRSSIVIYNVLGEGFHFHLFKRSAIAFVWNTFGIEKHPIS